MAEEIKDDKVKDGDGTRDGVPSDLADLYDEVNDKLKEANDLEDEIVDDTDDSDDAAKDDAVDDGVEDEDGDETGLDVLGYDAETLEAIKAINPDILEDIKGLLEKSTQEDTSEDDSEDDPDPLKPVEKSTGLTEEQLAALQEKDPEMAAIVASLNSQVGQLTESLNSVAEAEKGRAEQAERETHVINFKSANKKMDAISEDFPILGTYDKLPTNTAGAPDERNRSVKERVKVWSRANALHTAGITASFDDAIDEAITWYEGANAKNRATREVVKDLKSRAKKITARPTQQKTKPKKYVKGSEADKLQVIDEAFKAAGVE